jgi:hypothetical protein
MLHTMHTMRHFQKAAPNGPTKKNVDDLVCR